MWIITFKECPGDVNYLCILVEDIANMKDNYLRLSQTKYEIRVFEATETSPKITVSIYCKSGGIA